MIAATPDQLLDVDVSEFTSDDLFETIDRSVSDLLSKAGLTGPPVDALSLLREQFQYRIHFDEPHDAPRYGGKPKRRAGPNELILHPDSSEENRQTLAARAVAKKLIPGVLTKLGVGTENPGAEKSLIGVVTPRILLPTRWFTAVARREGFDLMAIKEQFPGANWEMIAWRMLEADDEPCIIAVVDDGSVSARRGNLSGVNRALTVAEQRAVARVQETDEPATERAEGWTATAWPGQGIPFRRILVRAVPDQI